MLNTLGRVYQREKSKGMDGYAEFGIPQACLIRGLPGPLSLPKSVFPNTHSDTELPFGWNAV